MNGDGKVVGWSIWDPDGPGELDSEMAVVTWTGSSPTELRAPDDAWVERAAINDVGHLAVSAHGGWLYDGSWTALGDDFRPIEINDDDQVVGSSASGAALWNGRELVDLNELVEDDADWELREAIDINEEGQIVGTAVHHGRQVAFLLDPITPVVFVPGAAASSLVTTSTPDTIGGVEVWLNCAAPLSMLSLDPNDGAPDLEPADAMRYMSCLNLDGRVVRDLDAYGTFLGALVTQGGFVEYDVDDEIERRTTDGCDTSQADRHPNLFVFAYDWRRDNALAAEQLADYIGCVRQFFPSGKINFATHSMGSLVARRFVLDHPDEEVGRMITIGAPWLGAPKLVNTLLTGDFAPPIASGEIIARMAQRFTATHQLMSAEFYHQVTGAPVLLEHGWDVDNNGVATEDYTYDQLASFLDGQYAVSDPAANATNFQGYATPSGGQVDWTGDQTGVEYFHVVGLQWAVKTIGQVIATSTPSCILGMTWTCTNENHIVTAPTIGDGTVPWVSATRQNGALDLSPGSTLLTVVSDGPSNDYDAEHTGLASNPNVIDTVIDLLQGGELLDDGDTEPIDASAGASATATALSGFLPSGAPIDTSLLVGEEAAQAAAEQMAATPQRTLTLLQVDGLHVSDSSGNSTRPPAEVDDGQFRFSVPGVGEATLGEHGRTLRFPAFATEDYTVTFEATDRPARIELTAGIVDETWDARRWIDLDLPEGTLVRLAVRADGLAVMHTDDDGDGEYDTEIPADLVLVGEAAADVEAPAVSVVAIADGGDGHDERHAVIATDAGTGVARTLWSTDGATFEPYDSPLSLDPAQTPTIWAFAEDHAGNRSPMARLDLVDVEVTPFTTATVSPFTTDAGWAQGPVTVALDAVPGLDGDVEHLTWSAVGAQPSDATTVAGESTTIDISMPGRTTILFSATSTDGVSEPLRSVTVGVDVSEPTLRLLAPASGAVVDRLTRITGTAADDESGVAEVEVRLTDTDHRSWDGESWVAGARWMPAGAGEQWAIDTGLPVGDELSDGSYRIAVRVTDRAGRTVNSEPMPFTVWPDTGTHVQELTTDDGDVPSGAVAISTRGVVTGYTGEAGSYGMPVRWQRGDALESRRPSGTSSALPEAANESGTAVGRATEGTWTGPAIWPADGAPSLLPALTDDSWGSAHAVNAAGVAVGESAGRPVRWDDGEITELTPIAEGGTGSATGISDTGLIVGHTYSEATGEQATVWRDGVPMLIGAAGFQWSQAMAVNGLDQIVGAAIDHLGRGEGFLYDAGAVTPIQAPFADWTDPLAINDTGTVVGTYAHRSDGSERAFMWTRSSAASTSPTSSAIPTGISRRRGT